MVKKEKKSQGLTVFELALFAMLGAIMFCSKLLMELIPNVHLLGMFTITFTLVYRKKALFPIYLYVLLNGVYAGFATWWIPYLYIWTILWAITMLLPGSISNPVKKWQYVLSTAVLMTLCGLHGICFGILYAPAQALMYGLSFETTVGWIIAGFPFDVIHGVGNFFAGTLIIPLVKLLKLLDKKRR